MDSLGLGSNIYWMKLYPLQEQRPINLRYGLRLWLVPREFLFTMFAILIHPYKPNVPNSQGHYGQGEGYLQPPYHCNLGEWPRIAVLVLIFYYICAEKCLPLIQRGFRAGVEIWHLQRQRLQEEKSKWLRWLFASRRLLSVPWFQDLPYFRLLDSEGFAGSTIIILV